jgi:hypothetical protein
VTNGNGRDHTSLRDAQPSASASGVRPLRVHFKCTREGAVLTHVQHG